MWIWSDRSEPKLSLMTCKEISSSHSVVISRSGKGVFWNDLCHPYSCRYVLNYLDAAFPKNRLGFPGQYFYPDIFSQMQTRFIYNLSFTWLISFSPYRAKFRRQITACKWGSLKLLVSKHVLISQMGTGTGLAWFMGKCWSFSFYKDHFKGLGRRQGWTLSLRWELQIFTAEAVIKTKMMRSRANWFKEGWYKSIIQGKDNWIFCLKS